ncbi:uncharacterized protein LOC113066414 [Carassius auratus]|uniref:Uncharacterized protein LOC113066414 n=1 Tax=Carassius auratus TaxID=7957 RepID=A0A6P6MCN2_CARAU|nr:uncharacterized protein LOC113066414 [Carassius auratus]
MDTYIVFKGNRRVFLKLADMRAERISRIFQIDVGSIYLADATNVVIFPLEDGHFSSFDLNEREHYEVHGGGAQSHLGRAPTVADHRHSFGFLQPTSVPSSNLPPCASTPRSFQRSIHISEPRDGKLFSTKIVVVRFLESEATVPSILDKVKLAMGNNETYVLAYALGSQVLESEATTGSFYWRQISRKIHAIEQATFKQWQQKRTSTRYNGKPHVLGMLQGPGGV